MKLLIFSLLLLGVCVFAKDRVKRQASYTFPGPRSERGYRQQNAAPVYAEEQDEDAYPAPRRQFQAQPVQAQYAPSQPRAPPPPPPAPVAPPPAPPAPVYEAPRPATQSAPPARRRASSSNSRANKNRAAPQQSLNGQADDEEEPGPDPLTLLLEDSQFTCSGKNDGYYADDSVNCQVFHYCVGGAKHSWMCPENTVFHQVHLNCVPDAQDICAQSQKFHFVNDYLYKPVDYEGPNNTARYSQRYYPDGYVVGDPLVAPQEQTARRPAPPQHQSYSAPAAPSPRPPARAVAAPPPPPPPAYRAPPQQANYRPAAQARPAPRPARPAESYPSEAPQGYRGSPQAQPAPSPQQYRGEQPQQAGPPSQAYRVSAQAAPPSSSSYSSEENLYQPQPAPQSRRPSAPQRSSAAAYTPPRTQHRPASARSAAGYPAYATNQAAGVQYDEDY
ncbi:hypothetical protein X975_26865, partial [Stegodyphus mimosarum]